MMTAIISILSVYAVASSWVIVYLIKKVRKLDNDVMNMRYVKVEKLPGGGWKLTDRKGKPFFEL